MIEPLRPATANTSVSHAVRATVGALGLALVGAGIVLTAVPAVNGATTELPLPELGGTTTADEAIAPRVATATREPVAIDPHRNDVQVVIAVDGTQYLALAPVSVDPSPEQSLADLDPADGVTAFSYGMTTQPERLAMPQHGTPRLVTTRDGAPATTLASLKLAQVPRTYREWLGTSVELGGECTTTVVGFAIVTQVAGYTFGEDGETPWHASEVFEQGASVLAAKLAPAACSSTFARASSLPRIQVLATEPLTALPDAAAVIAEVHARLVHAPAAAAVVKEWQDAQMAGAWDTDAETQWETRLLRHPDGTLFVLVHASAEHGCGGPEIGMLGLYRAEIAGRHVTLTTVTERTTDGVSAIDQAIDLDRDGTPELIGKGWLGLDTVITTAAGRGITVLDLPFAGCPC